MQDQQRVGGSVLKYSGSASRLVAVLCAAVTGFGTEFASADQRATREVPTSAQTKGPTVDIALSADQLVRKTLVFSAPVVTRTNYRLASTVLYFRSENRADSPLWLDVPWVMKGGGFCLQTRRDNQAEDCYQTMEDSTGQAFVRHTASGLIARVDAFEEGDTRNIRRMFAQAERIKQERRQLAEAQQMMMLGALFTMMSMGGGGGAVTDACITNPNGPGCRSDSPGRSSPAPRPDTSVGCAWGDRAYGTCR